MALDQLTPDQHQQIILAMKAEQTVVVKGVAGSGKSLTLLKKAKQISTFTKSYAIIVYTKSLKQYFVDELAEIGQSAGHVYYAKEWENSEKPHVDYMFVDECQDFNSEEIQDFRNHGQYCWFFGDTDQSIMEFTPTLTSTGHSVQSVEETARQLGVHAQPLGINHRLTVENARVGEHIKPETRLSMACYKRGPVPRIFNTQSQLEEIYQIYKEGDFSDIGILAYHNVQINNIKNFFESRGIPVEWKTKDSMTIDFKSTNPKVITFHCAKGLQFDNVFIPFCENYLMENKKNALYVACTRPLTQLNILFSGNLSPFLPQPDSEIYRTPQIPKSEQDENVPF